MNTNELIQKLLNKDWIVPSILTDYEDYDFYLWKQFEISKSIELPFYTDYKPKQDEKIFVVYEIYPNRPQAKWTIWRENDDPTYIVWEYVNYDFVIDLVLEDRLFTYREVIK